MNLPLNLCDAHHQAIAFLGDCPLCQRVHAESTRRTFTRELNRLTFVTHLDAALKETYGIDRSAQ